MTAAPGIAASGGTWAIVPAKDFGHAKSRLAPALDAERRALLARRLFTHVLDVLSACPELRGVLVATDSDEVQALAEAHAASVIRDSAKTELGEVIDRAIALLVERGAGAALIVMADLPELSAEDIRTLLQLGKDHRVVAAPDRHGEHTNALVLPLPPLAKTHFGHAQSLELHCRAARAGGFRPALHRAFGLELDIDEPRDLELWQDARERR